MKWKAKDTHIHNIHNVQELKIFSEVAGQYFQNLTVQYYYKNKVLDCLCLMCLSLSYQTLKASITQKSIFEWANLVNVVNGVWADTSLNEADI